MAGILGIIGGGLGIAAAIVSYVSERAVNTTPLFGGLFFLVLGISLLMRGKSA